MPLLDHFAPPLSGRRHWHSFHNGWAYCISTQLNSLLPLGYFAEANVQYGIEIDVAAFEEVGAVPPTNWTAPVPHATHPTTFTEAVVEIGIFSRSGGPQLAGAVELVSPANKDRPETRQALVNKCATYIQAGVGVVLVDVVTERTADFHRELLARLGATAAAPSPLFASAYRPVERDGTSQLDVWVEAIALGQPLPTMPLWLRGGLCLPVELEATYERTCTEQRLRLVVG
jgi:hypothetical protein